MTAYWISNLCELFNLSDGLYAFWPLRDNKNSSFNSLTRLIILLTLISALLMSDNYEIYLMAGAFSVLISIVIYYLTFNGAQSRETYLFSEHSTLPGHHHHEKHDEDKKSKKSKKFNKSIIEEEEEEEEEPVQNTIKTATGKIIKDTLPDLSLKNKKDSAKKEEFNDSVFVKGVRKNYDPKLLFNLK